MKPIAALILTFAMVTAPAVADPLPSWRDGDAKKRIIAFVEAVTDPQSADYVTPAARIATFDNDGTLWAEQPMYFQVLFALDYLAERAEENPSILTSDVLRAAAAGNIGAVVEGGSDAIKEVMSTSHSGMSVERFTRDARHWLETEKHPETGRSFIEHAYQPMLELLRYLRDEDFKTYIVSGGGLHFIRSFSEDVYGVAPENVIGTMSQSAYQIIDGEPAIIKRPALFFFDDKEGKPIGIDRAIGRRPILAVGNSDGDFAMLQWTSAGPGLRMSVLVHHTDDEREWSYDRHSTVGHLVRGLDEGPGLGWVVVDIKSDWNVVFPEAE